MQTYIAEYFVISLIVRTIVINEVPVVIIVNSAERTIQRGRGRSWCRSLTLASLGADPQRRAPGARAVARVHLHVAPLAEPSSGTAVEARDEQVPWPHLAAVGMA